MTIQPIDFNTFSQEDPFNSALASHDDGELLRAFLEGEKRPQHMDATRIALLGIPSLAGAVLDGVDVTAPLNPSEVEPNAVSATCYFHCVEPLDVVTGLVAVKQQAAQGVPGAPLYRSSLERFQVVAALPEDGVYVVRRTSRFPGNAGEVDEVQAFRFDPEGGTEPDEAALQVLAAAVRACTGCDLIVEA